ncbi:reverse transcriptase domain-containing protein [Tanacetum coccineum]
MLKFPVDGGIVTICSTMLIPAECAMVITSYKEIPKEAGVRHENFKIALHPNFPDQEVAIRGTLSAKGQTELCSLLKENLDIFAWQPSDMTGKKRGQAPEPAKAIQTEMAESDEEKMAFHTNHGVYCYTKMPFGLKNDGATYQRLVDKAFDSQVGQNIEVYIDDLVIKSHTEAEMLRDIDETFSEKCLPLFKTLKKCINKSDFHWTPDAEQAFKQLKQYLSELPLLVAPKPKEELIVYLSASYGAISVVLMTERGIVQTLVYFVSRALQGPELNYTPIEKLVLSLVFAAKRLRRYFQAHPIAILADFLVEKPDESPPDTSVVETPQEPWTLFTDRSSCVDGSGAGLILTSPEGNGIGVRKVHVSVDSKLVANQVLGAYVAKEENMIKYQEKVKSLVLVEILKEKFIQEKEVTTVVEEDGLTWMTPIIEYLKEGTLPKDKKEASKLRIKGGPDCTNYEKGNPQQPLTPITALWPFYKWGINIAGPFSEGPGKVKFLIVAMDYFTKWIEAKAVSTITGNQFSENPFKDWCEKLNITQRFASVKYSQSNGLVERANRSLGDGIKVGLGEGNKNWIEELPNVLWAHRTTIKSSHGDTPFSLTYGTEAVIPAEIGMPTYRTTAVDAVHNDEELWLNLDLLEERRERAAIREARAKLQMTKYYNARVRGVTFRPRDFVYHSNDASHVVARGKLGPK